MSHFFYIHADMSKKKNVWKIGIAKTPYSAVRARQRHCSEKFGLDYLFFGKPTDIKFLEYKLKKNLHSTTPRGMFTAGCQTEIFNITESGLLFRVQAMIVQYNLSVVKSTLTEKYTATNSGACPCGIPSEALATVWCDRRAHDMFGKTSEDDGRMSKGIIGKRATKASMKELYSIVAGV